MLKTCEDQFDPVTFLKHNISMKLEFYVNKSCFRLGVVFKFCQEKCCRVYYRFSEPSCIHVWLTLGTAKTDNPPCFLLQKGRKVKTCFITLLALFNTEHADFLALCPWKETNEMKPAFIPVPNAPPSENDKKVNYPVGKKPYFLRQVRSLKATYWTQSLIEPLLK